MRRTVKHARKVAVGLVGFPIVLLGIILIPLPGPGILVSFVGLLILSTEFEWADRYKQKLRQKLNGIYKSAKEHTEQLGQSESKTKPQPKTQSKKVEPKPKAKKD